jgi:hypothetical protein
LTFLGPSTLAGTRLVCFRFAVFVPLLALAAFQTGAAGAGRRRLFRAALLALVLAWLGFLTWRFRAFEQETASFRTVLAQIPTGKKILPLIFDLESEHVARYPYLHFGAWYEVEKGGQAGFSFLSLGRALLRYRPGHKGAVEEGMAWNPGAFNWERHGQVDYFLVRDAQDRGPWLAARSPVPIVRVAHCGAWYLYQPWPPG